MMNFDIPIQDLLPHKPPMVLIDRVLDFRDNFIKTSVKIRDGIPFYDNGHVPSYVAVEYMAQTIGVWRGLLSREQNQKPQIGFLLGTRKLTLETPYFRDGDELEVFGEENYTDEEIASFTCWITRQKQTVAQAVLNVFQPSDARKFLGIER